jgi:hypothetical protein
MRRVAYALFAAGALMLGALTSASAGCYGGDCYDSGYRSYGPSYYSERPVYRSYSSDRCGGGDCGYYGRSRYHTVYYERPSYGYDDYNDGSIPYYRNSCDYGYGGCSTRYSSYDGCGYSGCGGGYYRTGSYGGCGYSGCGDDYRTGSYGGCGYSGCGGGYYRTGSYGGCGSYGCGYRRHYYSGCGYYGCGGGYGVARYGGAWMQTGPAYASWGGGWRGGWGGCRTAYLPYGWSWYRASSC